MIKDGTIVDNDNLTFYTVNKNEEAVLFSINSVPSLSDSDCKIYNRGTSSLAGNVGLAYKSGLKIKETQILYKWIKK